MGAFHAYDVRGVYNRDFNRDDVYKIGYHLVNLLNVREVAVGRDDRLSSPEIHAALTDGIRDAGATVLDLGLATTPMVYYATIYHQLKASVQITASHNPKEYNGLKISRENAIPVGYEAGLQEIERRIKTNVPTPPAPKRGEIQPLDIKAEYIQYLRSHLQDIEALDVTVDCSNGMAALLVHHIFPDHYHYLYDTLDGTFPNHEANPLLPENTKALSQAVMANRSDAGIIFDGDGDRVVFVDDTGQFIPPDLMIAVLGHYFADALRQKPQPVVVDIRTSKSVEAHLTPMGARVEHWRVGRAYMASRLREVDGLFGGELAGHYYFKMFSYSDSGLLAAILLLNVTAQLKRQGSTLHQLIEEIRLYANTGELNFSITDKQAAMEAVRTHFTTQETPVFQTDIDGYRIEFADWWFNIRPSNTEPLLRFLAEAKDPQLLTTKVEELKAVLKPFLAGA